MRPTLKAACAAAEAVAAMDPAPLTVLPRVGDLVMVADRGGWASARVVSATAGRHLGYRDGKPRLRPPMVGLDDGREVPLHRLGRRERKEGV